MWHPKRWIYYKQTFIDYNKILLDYGRFSDILSSIKFILIIIVI